MMTKLDYFDDELSIILTYALLLWRVCRRFNIMYEVCGLTIASSHTSLHWKQRTHKYICCNIDHNNEIFIILTRHFSKEQYVLPEDNMRYAIETCGGNESVLV